MSSSAASQLAAEKGYKKSDDAARPSNYQSTETDPHSAILELQSSAGNRATSHLTSHLLQYEENDSRTRGSGVSAIVDQALKNGDGQPAVHDTSTVTLLPAGTQAYLGAQQDRTAKLSPTSTHAARHSAGKVATYEPSESSTHLRKPDALELLPLDQTVRLLEPMSVGELTEELYGESSLWISRLFPFNRWMLEGATADTRLEAGSILHVIPELLMEPHRTIVLSVLNLKRGVREAGRVPFIEAIPDTVLVPGNAVSYEVHWPNNWFMGEACQTRIEWWAESDKEAVQRFLIPSRVQGPVGLIDEARTFKVTMGAPGCHLIHCRLTSPSGERHELIYKQYVTTLPEKTEIAAATHREVTTFPELIAAERKTASEDWDLLAKEDLATLDKRLTALKDLEDASHDTDLIPIRAVYVSRSEAPLTVPLKLFVGYDPDKKDKIDTSFHLKLWDFTVGGPRTQTASGLHIDATLRELLRTFADDAPYPDGNIFFEVDECELRGHGSLLSYSGKIGAQSIAYSTDGGTKGAAVLRGLGFVAFAVGGVAALAGQAEIAVPALWVSGALAAAGATVSLKDRLEHGGFEWNVETGMDFLDIASALLSSGLASKVMATIRGLGSVTLTEELVTKSIARGIGTIQLGIMGVQHLAHIDNAIDTKDPKQVASALRAAIADGALILIMHRASRLQGSAKPGAESKDLFGPRNSYIGEPLNEAPVQSGPPLSASPSEELFGPRNSYIGEPLVDVPAQSGPILSPAPTEELYGPRGTYLGTDRLPNEPPPGRFVRQLTDTERELAHRMLNRGVGQAGAGPAEVTRWPARPLEPSTPVKVPPQPQTKVAEFTGVGENGERITVLSTPANPTGMIVGMKIPNITELPVQTGDEVLSRAIKAAGMGWKDWVKQSGHVHPLESGGIEKSYNREPMTTNYNKKNRRGAEIRLREFIKANRGKNLNLEITRELDQKTSSRTTSETFIVRDAAGKVLFQISVTDRGKLSGPDAPKAKRRK
ncbi:MAG: hypothetical protein ABI604_00520 [Nitrospirota bacterium]